MRIPWTVHPKFFPYCLTTQCPDEAGIPRLPGPMHRDRRLKMRLRTIPVLAHFGPNVDAQIHTDTSSEGQRVVLAQLRDGVERVIAHAHRTLTIAEKIYSTTGKGVAI